MDNNEFLSNQSNDGTYHATSNLNTAIENPEYAINNAMGVNIDNASVDQGMNNNSNLGDYSSFSTGSNVNYNEVPENNNTSYVPNQEGVNNFSNNNLDNSFVPSQEEVNNFSNNVDNSFESKEENSGNSFIPNVEGFSDNGFSDTASNQVVEETSYSYEPVVQQNKKKSITLSREVKVVIFIAFLLFIFIMFMPYIYDFFRDLQLVFTS